MVGKVGETGAVRFLERNPGKLSERFSASYLTKETGKLKASIKVGFAEGEANLLQQNCPLIYPLCEESLYEGLWNLAESMGKGLRVFVDKVPIRSFTIELGEVADENPYAWDSTGSVLGITENGTLLESLLEKSNLGCRVIGYVSDDNARCLVNNGRLSYITGKEKSI